MMSLFWPVVINHTGLMSVSKSLPFVKSVGQKLRLQLKNRHRPAILLPVMKPRNVQTDKFTILCLQTLYCTLYSSYFIFKIRPHRLKRSDVLKTSAITNDSPRAFIMYDSEEVSRMEMLINQCDSGGPLASGTS